MRKTVYYAEFFDDQGNPFKRKSTMLYEKPGPAKGGFRRTFSDSSAVSMADSQPVAGRLYELTGELTLIEEHGTVVEHIEGQEALFEL